MWGSQDHRGFQFSQSNCCQVVAGREPWNTTGCQSAECLHIQYSTTPISLPANAIFTVFRPLAMQWITVTSRRLLPTREREKMVEKMMISQLKNAKKLSKQRSAWTIHKHPPPPQWHKQRTLLALLMHSQFTISFWSLALQIKNGA